MTYHAQWTLGDVWMTLSDHQTTFLVLHGEPESMFFEPDFFDIITSRCCQAFHHDRLAERSSKPPLNLSLLEGGGPELEFQF